MRTNIEIAREYIRAIESGATGDALAKFFTPDVAITEMPNRVAPHGSTSDLAKALRAAERGQQLFKRQIYTITNILGDGDRVALEIDWIGTTAVPSQNLLTSTELLEVRLGVAYPRRAPSESARIMSFASRWLKPLRHRWLAVATAQ